MIRLYFPPFLLTTLRIPPKMSFFIIVLSLHLFLQYLFLNHAF